jgi:hypothetical protein
MSLRSTIERILIVGCARTGHECSPSGRNDKKIGSTINKRFTPNLGVRILNHMRIIKRVVIQEFGKRYPQARKPLDHWCQLTKNGECKIQRT